MDGFEAVPLAESSNIESAEYSPERQILRVTFKGKRTYEYDGVSAQKAQEFSRAESPGKFLHAFVKGQHQYRQVG